MRKAFFGMAAVAALSLGSAANAAVSIYSNVLGTDPYAAPAPNYTFDVGSRPASVGTGGAFITGTNGIITAQPFGTAAGTGAYGGDGYYFAAGPDTPDGTAGILDVNPLLGTINNISLVWGSVDAYNTLQFCATIACTGADLLGSFGGTAIFAGADGDRTDPNTNPVVTFLLTGGAESTFRYLKLSSTQNAFEIDNIAINPVPEPATWALMLVGFAGIGMTLRRRRQTALAQIA